MNYSPLNDPEFKEFREQSRKEAAKKRRRKALIGLSSVALVAITGFTLLALSFAEIAPSIPSIPNILAALFEKNETTNTEAPSPSSPEESEALPSSPEQEASPSEIVVNPNAPIICIDAGHGFTNSTGALDVGAGEDSEFYKKSLELTGTGLYEADLNLMIALKVRDLLVKKGYQVIMTREDYVYQHLSINQRALNVRNSEADLVVSIHGNSASPSAYGARVFYYNNGEHATASLALANAVAKAIDANDASLTKANVYEDTFAMLTLVKKPSILVETCFLTNTEDSLQALTEEWQNNMAKAIVDGIVAADL